MSTFEVPEQDDGLVPMHGLPHEHENVVVGISAFQHQIFKQALMLYTGNQGLPACFDIWLSKLLGHRIT